MVATIVKPERGNIVQYKGGNSDALVLAIRKDGTKIKIHIFGREQEFVWVPTKAFQTAITGDEKCWKCSGSGKFYMGGGTVNGVYTGKIGVCYGCQGKGTQNNADRIRNHYYWHRGVIESRYTIEDRPQGESSPTPEPTAPVAAAKPVATSATAEQMSFPHNQGRRNREASLIDCAMCNTVHRTDVPCPW